MTETVRLENGVLALPEDERAIAGIVGDAELYVTVGDRFILLTTRPSTFEKHAKEFARLMDEAGFDESTLLAGLGRVKEDLHRERYGGG